MKKSTLITGSMMAMGMLALPAVVHAQEEVTDEGYMKTSYGESGEFTDSVYLEGEDVVVDAGYMETEEGESGKELTTLDMYQQSLDKTIEVMARNENESIKTDAEVIDNFSKIDEVTRHIYLTAGQWYRNHQDVYHQTLPIEDAQTLASREYVTAYRKAIKDFSNLQEATARYIVNGDELGYYRATENIVVPNFNQYETMKTTKNLISYLEENFKNEQYTQEWLDDLYTYKHGIEDMEKLDYAEAFRQQFFLKNLYDHTEKIKQQISMLEPSTGTMKLPEGEIKNEGDKEDTIIYTTIGKGMQTEDEVTAKPEDTTTTLKTEDKTTKPVTVMKTDSTSKSKSLLNTKKVEDIQLKTVDELKTVASPNTSASSNMRVICGAGMASACLGYSVLRRKQRRV